MSAVAEGRESTLVLTSENSAAYYAKKLDLAPEPAKVAEPVKAEGDKAVESAKPVSANEAEKEAAEQQEADHPDPEKKQRLNLRFSELTQRAKDAEAKTAAETARAELAEKRAKELEAKLTPPPEVQATDELGPEPKPDQFKDAFEYAKALAEYAAEKALHERDEKDKQARERAEQEKVVSTFRQRVDALKKEMPDYDSVIAASPVVVSAEVREAILDSDMGPRLMVHLAQNPDFAEKLKAMKVGPALRELGKLEAKLSDAKAPAPKGEEPVVKPAAAATEISRAPEPITPIRGSGSALPAVPIDAQGEFYGTAAQWRELRKAGKIK